MIKVKKTLIYIFIIIAAVSPASAFDKLIPVAVDNSEKHYDIGKNNLEILVDKTGSVSFAEVSSQSYSRYFRKSEKDIPNFRFSGSAYWVRFNLTFPEAGSGGNNRWFIECGWPNLSSVIAYIPEPGGTYRKSETGAFSPLSSREIPYKNYLFRIEEQPGKTVTVYLRVSSTGVVLIPVSVLSERELYKKMGIENILAGVFSGIILIMIFYHLLLYAAVQDRDYIYLIMFFTAQIIFQVLSDSSFQGYFNTGGEATKTMLYAFLASSAVIMNTLFSIHILNLREDLPAAARLFYFFIFIYLIIALASPVIPHHSLWGFFFILSLFSTFCMTVTAFIRLAQGYSIARYFVIIIILQMSSHFANTLLRFDLVPLNWYTEHIRPIFSIVQALIISYAISLRIRRMESERIEAQSLAIENLMKAEQIKDEILANTSHELKTPLHGIVGLSELMLKTGKEKLNTQTRENLLLISNSGRRLMTLVNDILDFSSIRHGKLALDPKAVDLHRTVSSVFTLLHPLTEGKAIELRNSVPPHFSPVFADEERLRQMLTNLAGNSLKFTPFGVIEVSAVIDNAGMAAITVSDTGTGIRPEHMDRIFNSFEQGEGSISRRHGGTGLGLAITRKLAELHGGTIEVESEPGHGSAFTFTLPVAKHDGSLNMKTDELQYNHLQTAGGFVSPESSADDTGGDLYPDRPSILVVEDDPVSLKILKDYLSELRYNVHAAIDGHTALAKIKSSAHIDLVLLDVMMPVFSGYDLLKKIRQDYSTGELPVILVTARAQLDDINSGFEAGANDYIIKPFGLDELSHRVENMLKLKNVLPQAEPGLMIRERGSCMIVQYSRIIYLSSSGKKTVVHTTGEDIEVSLILKDLETKLPGTFIRIHKQFVINTEYIAKVTHTGGGRYEALLNDADDTRLAVGRSFINTLRCYFEDRGKRENSSNA